MRIIDLRAGYSAVRRNYIPGALEYEHATGAIMALDQLADHAYLLLTTERPAGQVVAFPARPQPPRRPYLVGRDPGDETDAGGAA
jgi:hypothetical protein